MGKTRLDFHEELKALVGNGINVYFQPPETIKLTYPCIIYSFTSESVNYADNIRYKNKRAYKVTVIDKNPDSTIPDKMASFEYCKLNSVFTSDNLNHFAYIIYY